MGASSVSKDLDVHMNADMTCQDCHTFEDHHVSGRGMDLRVDDTSTVVSCDNAECHGSEPHPTGSLYNLHTDNISCTACHITSYGKVEPVEVARNWELTFSPGMLTKESNPAPIHVWWNRTSEIMDLADQAVFDSDGNVVMAKPGGGINDSDSKIYAARLHRGRQPWNNTSKHMLPFNVPTAKATNNMTQAIFNATGVMYDPVQYVNSTRYMGLFHGVSPKEDALTCGDCHDDHKLNYETLGYNVTKDASGNLINATKPGIDWNLATLASGSGEEEPEGPSAVQINDWTLPSTGTRGEIINATVNIKNTGNETTWFTVSISGTQPTTGSPIGGLGTVQLNAGDSVEVPIMIVVPGSSDTGDYTLIPAVYKQNDYLAGDPQAIGSGKSVTIS